MRALSANLILVIALLAGAPSISHGAASIVNGFAAVVNDKVITWEDVESAVSIADVEVARLKFDRDPQGYARELNRLRQEALTGLIETELILGEFKTAGYQLPESIVEEQIKDRIREQFGDRATLMRTLQAQKTTFEAYRERIRERFIVEAMTDKHVSSAILISPYKIEKYFEDNLDQFQLKDRVKLRMISLWHRADRGPVATKKLAEQVHEQLEEGTAFPELAVLYSDDPKRREGGDRGWIEKGGQDLRTDLQEEAFSLEVGKPSAPIEKDEGCYLMLVEESETAHTRSLSDVQFEIEAILQQKERARLREAWINRLREKSFLRTYPLR